MSDLSEAQIRLQIRQLEQQLLHKQQQQQQQQQQQRAKSQPAQATEIPAADAKAAKAELSESKEGPSVLHIAPAATESSATTPTTDSSPRSSFTPNGRLIIVTNRLPMSVSKKKVDKSKLSPQPTVTCDSCGSECVAHRKPGKGKSTEDEEERKQREAAEEEARGWSFSLSSGGLVSALNGVKGLTMTWIGWPGGEIEDPIDQRIVTSKLHDKGCVPVFLTKDVADAYYNGFSNAILWPLMHYIQPPIEVIQGADSLYAAYEAANRKFAQVVLNEYKDGDVVWVHDYHLFLLPALLRAKKPMMKIGFFLHTPFPSSEIYKTLPWREELLNGVLSCDLIGFHTHDYARHFRSACTRVLGLQCNQEGVELGGGGFAQVSCFPIGIDPDRFLEALQSPAVQKHHADFEREFRGKKVILGIDRLDYTKGISHKLFAMERFLQRNPEWIGKCVLVQIAVPSRQDVTEYQKLSRKCHELVGRINGKYGTLTDAPIHFLDTSISFERMCALYRVADTAIVTSVRDGMNLVSYEYIICQTNDEKAGVLILSEFAGAAQSLGAGAISVNPWDLNQLSDAIRYALTMSGEERMDHHAFAFQLVKKHTAQYWAESFLQALYSSAPSLHPSVVPPKLDVNEVVTAFKQARHRVIISGLVGTLTYKRLKGMSLNMNSQRFRLMSRSSPGLMKLVHRIAGDPFTTFIVLTSRSQSMCERVLGESDAWLAAENGYFLKRGQEQPWQTVFENVDVSWMDEVNQVFTYFTERTPRSFIEQKSTYISWHYHDCDEVFGEKQARDLLLHLMAGPLANTPTQIINHSKIIQVRPIGVAKGFLAEKLITELEAKRGPVDFVLCMGNFMQVDEDIFSSFYGEDKRKVLPSTRQRGTSVVEEGPVDQPYGLQRHNSFSALTPSTPFRSLEANHDSSASVSPSELSHSRRPSISSQASTPSQTQAQAQTPSQAQLQAQFNYPSPGPLSRSKSDESGLTLSTIAGLVAGDRARDLPTATNTSTYLALSSPLSDSPFAGTASVAPLTTSHKQSHREQGDDNDDKFTPLPLDINLRSNFSLPESASATLSSSSRSSRSGSEAVEEDDEDDEIQPPPRLSIPTPSSLSRRTSNTSFPNVNINGQRRKERTVFTVTVGKKQSRARYLLESMGEVEKLLDGLSQTLPGATPRSTRSRLPHSHSMSALNQFENV